MLNIFYCVNAQSLVFTFMKLKLKNIGFKTAFVKVCIFKIFPYLYPKRAKQIKGSMHFGRFLFVIVTFLLSSCYVFVMFLLRFCCILVTFLLRFCHVLFTFFLRSCYVIVTFLLRSWYVLVTFLHIFSKGRNFRYFLYQFWHLLLCNCFNTVVQLFN